MMRPIIASIITPPPTPPPIPALAPVDKEDLETGADELVVEDAELVVD
jgi:hypothetical protein